MNMQFLMNGSSRLVASLGVLFIGAMVWTGCGPSEEEDPCETVSCDFGVCHSETGECMNRDSCRVDVDCVPGYQCENRSCAALSGCESDDDCEAGVCGEAGTCVNPDTCSDDSECVARTYCDIGQDDEEGTCEPDPCNSITCARGVCERGTDNCVSAQSCTKRTEVADCVAGEKCVDGNCKSEETFCDDITCERGVCSFEEGGCTEAPDCEGDDSKCLEGRYCNEMGQCQPDLCEQRGVTCEEGGECVRSTGKCENASSCEANADCLNNPEHLCVEGTCRLASSACGDAGGDGGCPGNQSCEYDGENRTASCVEPDTCETSFDCSDDRQCSGRSCLEPQQCEEDDFEPNDSDDEATVFHDVARNGTLPASVCSGATDVYALDTTEIASADTRGTLSVEIDVPKRLQGLGAIEMSLVGPDGADMGTASTGALGTEGHIELTTEITVADRGVFTAEVTAGDDVKTSGVNYELSADVLSSDSVEACNDATPIRVDQRISGTTEGAEATDLGSLCTEPGNPAPEKVYALEVDAPQEVSFRLNPQLSDSDLTMSLRSRCKQPASEKACVDATGAGEAEELTALLGEGTHYLVVQAPAHENATGGPFELVVDRIFTACSPRDNYCDGEGTANVCTSDGGRFRQVDCDNGCNLATGKCHPPEGNICRTAPAIDPDNASTRQITLEQATDEYGLEAGSCLGTGPARTGGPDQAFEVTVPPRTAFSADVIFQNEVEGSAYLVGDCTDTDGTCETGAQGSVADDDHREQLTYANLAEESDSDDNSETFYLVVDTAADQSVTTAELQVTYEDVVCEPDTEQCSGGGDVEQCKEFGRSFETIETCNGSFGCDEAKCVAEACDSAYDITSDASQSGGATYSGDWSNFKNDYEADDTCGQGELEDRDTAGAESVYKVDLQADEVLTATLSGDGDFALYLKGSQDCGTSATSCPAWVEKEGDPAELVYLADSAETLYLVADRESESGGTFTLDVQIQAKECSSSSHTRQCDGSGNLQFCEQGLYSTYACDGGCSSAQCGNPQGQVCGDEIPMSDGDSDVRVVEGIRSLEVSSGDSPGDCSFTAASPYDVPNSADRIYAIDLQDGEELSVDWDEPINTSAASYSGVLYLLDSCGNLDSCLENSIAYPPSFTNVYPITDALTYKNDTGQAQTVYLYAALAFSPSSSWDFEVTTNIQ